MALESIFRLVTLLLLFSAFGVSGYYRRRADRQAGDYDRSGDRRIAFMRLVLLVFLLPLLMYMIHPPWVAWLRWELPLWLRWIGVGTAGLMIPAFVWLFKAIQLNISPSHLARRDHTLVTTGPYRFIRHPLYTFGFTFYTAIALITGLWWLLIGVVVAVLLIGRRTPLEEEQLIAKFGEDYRSYMASTGRYFPRLR